MNLELSSEQKFLRESAAGVLGRLDLYGAARTALDGGAVSDQWHVSEHAGWEELVPLDGSDETGVFDAMLVLEQCGAALASPGLIGHLSARAVLNGVSEGERLASELGRMAVILSPLGAAETWSTDALRWKAAPDLTDCAMELNGTFDWVLDGVLADTLLIAGEFGSVSLVFALSATGPGVTVVDATRYDMTRPLARVILNGARARLFEVDRTAVDRARYFQHALLAADELGSAATALAMATAYAKERYTFGRQIGSYQGIKHRIVEMVRLSDTARSLLFRAAWADESGLAHEFAVSACAARIAADRACTYATDQNLYVHGGIGATWEHDGPLLFRRGQVSSRLLGGRDAAAAHLSRLMMSGPVPSATEAVRKTASGIA